MWYNTDKISKIPLYIPHEELIYDRYIRKIKT